jgi:hypothetical protein
VYIADEEHGALLGVLLQDRGHVFVALLERKLFALELARVLTSYEASTVLTRSLEQLGESSNGHQRPMLLELEFTEQPGRVVRARRPLIELLLDVTPKDLESQHPWPKLPHPTRSLELRRRQRVVVPDEHVGREAGRPQDLLLLDHVEALGEAPIEVRERGLQLGLPAYDQTPIGDRNAFPQLELQVEDAFHVPRIDAASVDPEPQRPRGHGMEPSALLPA